MKKRILAVLLMAALCLGMLAGCGGNGGVSADQPQKEQGTQTERPDNNEKNDTELDTEGNAGMKPGDKDTDELDEVVGVDKILEDVNSYRYTVLPENAELTGCEIIKRQTNPEDKEDIVYCRLIGPEEGFRYSQYYVRLLYNFYDEGGWILDEMTADQVDQWGVLGYLDGQGNPVEDGLVYIRNCDNSPTGEAMIMYPEGYTPSYTAPPTGADDDSLIISNDGLWQNYGVVSDMQGNVVSGLTGSTIADRYTLAENSLVYLCDMNGNKLSAGYEEVSYAGAITGDNDEVIDHRWRVCKDGMLGFLNDAGQEVVALKYDAYENQRATFLADGEYGKLCEIKDGNSRILINSDGKELVHYGESSELKVEPYCNGYLVIDPNAARRGEDTYYGYDTDGNLLFAGDYYNNYHCANSMGVCLYRHYWDNEDQYYPDWVMYDWEGNERSISHRQYEITSLYCLGGKFYNVDGELDGVMFNNDGSTSQQDYMVSAEGAQTRAYGHFVIWGGAVLDESGNVIIPPGYGVVWPVGGGLYIVKAEDGSEALFDWTGNQRTQFFDSIETRSENGEYFIIELDGKLYALKTPLSEAELQSAPVYDAKYSRG